MLSASAQAQVACDPYFPLFPALRNALVQRGAEPGLREGFDPAAPLQDYYFTDARIALMDVVQAGDLGVPFEPARWPELRASLAARAAHECPDLVPHLDELPGSTFGDVIDHALALIARVRGGRSPAWVGFKEVWTIEFCAALARSHPEAAFVVLLRDPRSVVASMHAIDGIDAAQIAHTLSYARHWRKYVAFARHYAQTPRLAGRLHVLTYERLVAEPEKTARGLCDFLGIDYDAHMIDPRAWIDPATGTPWQGNSSFAGPLAGISGDPVERWRQTMDPRALRLVELVCGPEMRLAGYEPVTDSETLQRDAGVLDYLVENGRGPCSWRSDLGDPQQDHRFELLRRRLLAAPAPEADRALIRRCFLFEPLCDELRGRAA